MERVYEDTEEKTAKKTGLGRNKTANIFIMYF